MILLTKSKGFVWYSPQSSSHSCYMAWYKKFHPHWM